MGECGMEASDRTLSRGSPSRLKDITTRARTQDTLLEIYRNDFYS